MDIGRRLVGGLCRRSSRHPNRQRRCNYQSSQVHHDTLSLTRAAYTGIRLTAPLCLKSISHSSATEAAAARPPLVDLGVMPLLLLRHRDELMGACTTT